MPIDRTSPDPCTAECDVLVCADNNQDRCVDVGRINLQPETNEWSITPKIGSPLDKRFPTAADARLALIRHELEAWKRERVRAREAWQLLNEFVLAPNIKRTRSQAGL
jgi:hypothetical protein